MNVMAPVVLTCGELTAEIGTTVKVSAEVDTVKFGRNLAALLRQAADHFDSVEPCLTTDRGDTQR